MNAAFQCATFYKTAPNLWSCGRRWTTARPRIMAKRFSLKHVSVKRGNATMTFAHVILERAGGRIVVEGCATLAAVNQDGKTKRLPRSLLDMPASIQDKNS